MTVNKERVKMLVDALRSGEFAQARGSLKRREDNVEAYCCLGVATEVALRNGLVITDEQREYYGFPWVQVHQVMCEPVATWFGLDVNPNLTGHDLDGVPRDEKATVWNDDLAADFNLIADRFESTYLRDETPTA